MYLKEDGNLNLFKYTCSNFNDFIEDCEERVLLDNKQIVEYFTLCDVIDGLKFNMSKQLELQYKKIIKQQTLINLIISYKTANIPTDQVTNNKASSQNDKFTDNITNQHYDSSKMKFTQSSLLKNNYNNL